MVRKSPEALESVVFLDRQRVEGFVANAIVVFEARKIARKSARSQSGFQAQAISGTIEGPISGAVMLRPH